jgi:hypothetical protein
MPVTYRRGTPADAPSAADLWLRARKAAINLAKRERPQGAQLWTVASNARAHRFYERQSTEWE